MTDLLLLIGFLLLSAMLNDHARRRLEEVREEIRKHIEALDRRCPTK